MNKLIIGSLIVLILIFIDLIFNITGLIEKFDSVESNGSDSTDIDNAIKEFNNAVSNVQNKLDKSVHDDLDHSMTEAVQSLNDFNKVLQNQKSITQSEHVDFLNRIDIPDSITIELKPSNGMEKLIQYLKGLSNSTSTLQTTPSDVDPNITSSEVDPNTTPSEVDPNTTSSCIQITSSSVGNTTQSSARNTTQS